MLKLLKNNMQYDNNNIFAKILRKELPANIIYEDDIVIAFPDINPIAETHILVIPKKPYISYTDFVQQASSEDVVAFFKSLDIIAQQFLGENASYKLLTNNGSSAGQIIFHFHCHIIAGKIKGNPFAKLQAAD
jgi:histidine triad (HIT) family protein